MNASAFSWAKVSTPKSWVQQSPLQLQHTILRENGHDYLSKQMLLCDFQTGRPAFSSSFVDPEAIHEQTIGPCIIKWIVGTEIDCGLKANPNPNPNSVDCGNRNCGLKAWGRDLVSRFHLLNMSDFVSRKENANSFLYERCLHSLYFEEHFPLSYKKESRQLV